MDLGDGLKSLAPMSVVSVKDRFQSGGLCSVEVIFQTVPYAQDLFRITLSGRDQELEDFRGGFFG
jgi:hypothetical protein